MADILCSDFKFWKLSLKENHSQSSVKVHLTALEIGMATHLRQ